MVEGKDTEKDQKTAQIKTTTGAWWKSSAAGSPEKKDNGNKDSGKTKTSVRNNAADMEQQAAGETDVDDVVLPAKAELSTVPKAASNRRGRSRKPAAKKKPADSKDSPQKQQSQTDEAESIEASFSSADTLSENDTSSENSLEPAAKPARKRGRPAKKVGLKTPREEDKSELTADSSQSAEVAGSSSADSGKAKGRVRGKKAKNVSQETSSAEKKEEPKKATKLLINAEEPEECRLVLLEDGRLESIHVSTVSRTQRKNNIYKARIVAIEPSLQAAFVEYGTDKNGFLPFSEIHPEYYKQDLSENTRHLIETHQWKKLRITDVVERGQNVLAQVVKEEVGKKGANMTTFLSIPGRCLVLMPGSDSAGISRKISGEQRRSQLRETMNSFEIPEGIGWIVRTASFDITESDLSRDVDYLLKLWEDIRGKGQAMEGEGLVYEDHHSVLRFLREHFDPSFEEILVDDKTALEEVRAFIKMLPKAQQNVKVRLHQGARPIFNQYSVEDQIESIYQPQVNLPSGGSIVIDPTEALVAIDVNSGSTSRGKNFEESIFQANLEAASELARQLRLRDLGGLIVVDFIDMRSRKNIAAVEKQVKVAMKKDKAKIDYSRISKFGLMEISRQKLGAPIEAGNYHRCEHCKGRGIVRSIETLSLFYLRRIQTGASRKPVDRVECHFPLDVASYLLNRKRTELSDMEKRYQVEITINARSRMKPAENEIIFHKAENEAKAKKQA
jgi:ribonuclease E